MKYLALLALLVGCGPRTELLGSSKTNQELCEKACKEDYGENASCSFVGEISGNYYCND